MCRMIVFVENQSKQRIQAVAHNSTIFGQLLKLFWPAHRDTTRQHPQSTRIEAVVGPSTRSRAPCQASVPGDGGKGGSALGRSSDRPRGFVRPSAGVQTRTIRAGGQLYRYGRPALSIAAL